MRVKKYFFALVSTFFLSQQVEASLGEKDIRLVAQEALDQNMRWPEPYEDGRIQTLNKKGAASPQIDRISRAFLQHAALPGRKVLEIGAAYGLACLEGVKNGAQDYHANDLDERHLQILAANIYSTDPELLSSIKLVPGHFPNDFSVQESLYDAILSARVFHFMHPKELKGALRAVYTLLKPGGKVYAVMLSPYIKGYAPFIPEFEKRVNEGMPNPGYVENLLDYADYSVVPKNVLQHKEQKFFFFNIKTAKDAFEESGFCIEEAIEMPLAYPSAIWALDGRENIGIIAYKPK